MDEGNPSPVQLYIYDLSQGMATVMSPLLLGRQIQGVWHTAVVIFEREYFYSAAGIQCCSPGTTSLGQPGQIENIGNTFVTSQVFNYYLRGLAESTFKGSNYNLLNHNCNTFSEEICQFLCGTSIPKYILDLPQEFLSTPFGQIAAPLIQNINIGNNFSFEPQIPPRQNSPDFDDLCNQIDQVRSQSMVIEQARQTTQKKIAKIHNKKDKKRRKDNKGDKTISESEYSSNSGMSEVEHETNGGITMNEIPSEMLPSEEVLEAEERDRAEEEEKRKNRQPAIVFKDIDAKMELEAFVKLVDGQLSKEEESSIEELHQYLIENEGSWALGDNFLVFIGRVLGEKNFSTETRVHLIRALAAAALKDDVILLLHQDRKDHILMNYAQDIDKHPPEEQQAWGLFMCNLFENISPSEWLLYISEWSHNSQQISNIRATTKVAVHCLLATCPTLQEIGSAIIYNLGIKEVKTVKFHWAKQLRHMLPEGSKSKVFDDIAVELTMAILQFFNSKPSEEHLFRTITALARFLTVSSDVPQFISMIGPHPKIFKGTSPRIDELIGLISRKVK